MADLSIIIVNYNTKQDTVNCINSIYEKTKDVDFEITVVDNNSQDGSVEEIKKIFPSVKIIENKENLGFGRANNKGIKNSESKYIFLLNSDTILKNNAVKILYDFMEQNPHIGASGGLLFDANNNISHSFGKLPELKDKIKYASNICDFFEEHKKKEAIPQKPQDVCEVGYISGADLMLRRDVIDKTGAFDEDFFLYYEETELQYRIKKAGYKIYIVPQAEITHLIGKSLDDEKRRLLSYKSEYLYFKKCYKLTKFSPVKLIFFAVLSIRYFSHPKRIAEVIKYVFVT